MLLFVLYLCRYWSIAIFVYALVCVVFMILGYNLLNLMIVPPLHSVHTIQGKDCAGYTHTHTHTHARTHTHTLTSLTCLTDEHTVYQTEEEALTAAGIRGGSLPPLRDIPIEQVCRTLYLSNHTLEQQEGYPIDT